MCVYNFETENNIDSGVIFKFFKKGVQFGQVKFTKTDTNLYIEDSTFSSLNGIENITLEFINYLYKYCEENSLCIVSKHCNEVINYLITLFRQSKFIINYIYIIENYPYQSPYKDEYVLKDYLFHGEDYFLKVFEECSLGDPSINEKHNIHDRYKALKDNKIDNTYWRLVFQDDKIIGIIMPFARSEATGWNGYNASFGTMPEQRHKGHGTKLLSLAVDIFFNDLKVTKYIGMTDIDNYGMIKLYNYNKFKNERKEMIFYIWE